MSYSEHDRPPTADPGDWVELASPTPARHGRTYVTVDGRYAQLKIEAHEGRPLLRSVRVVFADGKQRVVKLGHRRTHIIDLDGDRAIDHVVVVSDRRAKGTYTVHGARSPTGVATR